MITKLIKDKGGQSLFEIIVAIGLAALIIGSATTAIVVSLQSDRNNVATQKAYAIAEDMLHNVRSYSESNWATLYSQTKGSGTQYYLDVVATNTLGIATGTEEIAFTFTATSTEENVTYTTWFSIENVSRDSDDQSAVTSGGVNDPTTQKIVAHVSWPVSGETREIQLPQQISNIRSFTAQSNNWGGSSGSTSTVTLRFDGDYFSKSAGIIASATSVGVSP